MWSAKGCPDCIVCGTVRLHNNSLVTVPVFDTKRMIISLLSDPSVMIKRTLQKGIMCLLVKLTIILLIRNMGGAHW
jgi:hypothetical protein